jgi:hypothetical protein
MSRSDPTKPIIHGAEHNIAGNDPISDLTTHASRHLVGGADAAIFPNLLATYFLSKTFTNIGTSFVEVWPAAAFNPINLHSIDFSGIHFVRMVYIVDYIGAGTMQCQLVDMADNSKVLVNSGDFTTDKDPGDSGWVALPAWFVNKILKIELMAKSTTAGDDPVYKGFALYGK